MNKNIRTIFIASGISGVIIALSILLAPAASALSIQDIQTRIQELLAKISVLQDQLRTELNQNTINTTPPSVISVTAVPRICKEFPVRGLAVGIRGSDVTGLQEFLRAEGFLSAQATGYFGSQTHAALSAWQANGGIQAVGIFGPLSRERVRIWCQGRETLTVSPAQGQAPLTVVVASRIGDEGIRPSAYDGQDTLIDFGDGTERQWVQCETVKNDQFGGQTAGGTCRIPASFKHLYSQNGAYTVTLLHAGGMCMGGCPERVVATAFVTVGSENSQSFDASPSVGPAPLTVDFTYRPANDDGGQYYIDFGDGQGQLMNTQQIYCIRAPCISPSVARHTYSSTGSYTASVSRYYACLYSNPRCLMAQPAPLASAQVTVTGATSGNRAPSISAFSGPTTLSVNASGTWTIRASDPENQTLSYSVTWGDEGTTNAGMSSAAPMRDSFVQTTTFTHSYARAGVYTVAVVVTDASGASAKSSTTVHVGSESTACTMQYDPVCGRPVGCTNTCPPGMACPAICQLHQPQTYGNRCMMNASGAEFLYQGECRADTY